jgi:predicted TPR repeat methyltransferase
LLLIDDVLAREPANVEALAHRGAALGLLERHAEALACYDRVLALESPRVEVLFHRATTLGLLGRDEEAVAAFDAMLARHPAHAEAWLRRGQSLLRLARHDDALASIRKALDLDPAFAEAWTIRGTVLAELRRNAEAAAAFEQAIEHGGDPQLNGFFLAGVAEAGTPVAPPRHYVETLFDDYAETFDDHLLNVLRYRAHEVQIARLRTLWPRRFRRALDLGCGTGLYGVLLQPVAEAIDGADLSSNMLEKAAARKIYADLFHADIGEHLRATDRRYDLVVAGDVFIYVGDPAPIFAGVAGVIEPGGAFCFSVELHDGPGDYTLRPTLRYAHSEESLRRLAAEHGFTVEEIDRHPVREDQQQPIPGLLVYLTKR